MPRRHDDFCTQAKFVVIHKQPGLLNNSLPFFDNHEPAVVDRYSCSPFYHQWSLTVSDDFQKTVAAV